MTRFDDFEFILNVDMRRREVAVSYASIHREEEKVKGSRGGERIRKRENRELFARKKIGYFVE